MSEKATYEIIISQKLEQVSLPNLQDAIWLRIEQQLDLDMPTDEGGPDAPDAPSAPDWTNLLYKAGPFAVIVALVTIFFINKNNTPRNRPANNINTVPAARQVEPASNPGAGPPVQNQGNAAANKPTAKFPVATKEPLTQPVDSIAQPPALAISQPPAVDSVQQAAPILAQADAQEQKTVPPPQKKPRGVKGISASDYRLVPKKDSTQQNE
jgi:hypothetical protein